MRLIPLSELKWQLVLLLALVTISPAVYAYVQGYWALLLVPTGQLFGVDGRLQWAIVMIVMNLAGATIVATVLALPLGYFTKERAAVFGGTLSLGPLVFMLWLVLEDGWNAPSYLGIVRVMEYMSIVIAFVALARVGSHFRTAHEKVA